MAGSELNIPKSMFFVFSNISMTYGITQSSKISGIVGVYNDVS